MFLETPRPNDYLFLKITKIVVGLIGLASIALLPLFRIVESGMINPIDFIGLPQLIWAVSLTALHLIPEMLSHPLVWLFAPLIITAIYLLIGRKVKIVLDWSLIIIALLLSIAAVAAYLRYNPNLDESSLYNGNLVVSVRNSAAEAVPEVQVCVMRYAFQADHLWLCRTSNERGKIFFSAKPGLYDISIGDQDYKKYPDTTTQRTTVENTGPTEITMTLL